MPTRVTKRVPLPSSSIGTQCSLIFHRFGRKAESRECVNVNGKAYIQATLHADELPGLLVAHHLIQMLEEADKKDLIAKEIVIVPFANPIGLGQQFLGKHMGRFNIATGVNFNRAYPSVADRVASMVSGKLSETDETHNINIIREAIRNVLDEKNQSGDVESLEIVMKKTLMREACDADIVLDLHCDTDAIMHMYTHDRLWPELSDLAAYLGSQCHLLDSDSGGNAFDEANSTPFAVLADRFKGFPIPMACQAATVELRGELDVNDSFAKKDALALFNFLRGRGYIKSEISADGTTLNPIAPLPAILRDPSPLTGVDMVKASAAGVITWHVKSGDIVSEGQVLGEIVNIEDPFATRTALIARTSGIIFGKSHHNLAIPGDIVIKVAGDKPLPWRTGSLLTSK